jgi:hypothetical protein
VRSYDTPIRGSVRRSAKGLRPTVKSLSVQIYRQVPASTHAPPAHARHRRASATTDNQATGRHAPVVQNFSKPQKLTGLQSDAHHTITGRVWH